MATPLETLEELVTQAADRIAMLQAEVARLEQSLRDRQPSHPDQDAPPLADEHRRLLEERAVIRDRVRALMREIDRAL